MSPMPPSDRVGSGKRQQKANARCNQHGTVKPRPRRRETPPLDHVWLAPVARISIAHLGLSLDRHDGRRTLAPLSTDDRTLIWVKNSPISASTRPGPWSLVNDLRDGQDAARVEVQLLRVHTGIEFKAAVSEPFITGNYRAPLEDNFCRATATPNDLQRPCFAVCRCEPASCQRR